MCKQCVLGTHFTFLTVNGSLPPKKVSNYNSIKYCFLYIILENILTFATWYGTHMLGKKV